MTLTKRLTLIGIFDGSLHRTQFLQHIRDMQYIRFKGELTLAQLRLLLSEYFTSCNPDLVDAAKAFCDHQLEGKDPLITEDTIVIPGNEDLEKELVLHFDVLT